MFTLNRSLTVLKSARTCFFLLGFAIAAWAPLVPYIQKDLSLSKVELSLMILTMGLGSIIGMLIILFCSFSVSLFTDLPWAVWRWR